MNYIDKYNEWLQKVTDEKLHNELLAMSDDEQAKENAFYKDLEFGTGGLRGTMGAGSNCLNIYTIAKATSGLAVYMQKHNLHKIAITYDSRNNSMLFSQVSAAVLAKNGIEVVITKECMPTPFLSFAIRKLCLDAGINITASHNPSIYNGYKVFDNTGCQVLDEVANEITSYIEEQDPFSEPLPTFADYENKQITYASDALTEEYIATVLDEKIDNANNLCVSYSPLCGAGYSVVPKALSRLGVNDLFVVEEQSKPNGDFPTCPFPNPEKLEALEKVLALAKERKADIVIANDPDCDRVGVAVNNGGAFQVLTGNEVGILLCDYVLNNLQKQNKLTKNAYIVKTIVTTVMAEKLAEHYGVNTINVLTGFKYIGDTINNNPSKQYVFGFEESCGYLKGTYARDKDGVVADVLICGLASQLKKQGKTLCDKLQELYHTYGNYKQTLASYRFEGAKGAEQKEKILQNLRKKPIETLAGSKINYAVDYLTQTTQKLPKADVLLYRSENGSQLVIRPSGTEPLIKCYLTVCSETENDKRLADIKTQLDKLFA